MLSFTRAAGGLRLAASCCPSPCVSVCLSVVHSYCAWGYLGVTLACEPAPYFCLK